MYIQGNTPDIPYIDGFDDDSIFSVSYLGIVAGAYDSLGTADIIDTAIENG